MFPWALYNLSVKVFSYCHENGWRRASCPRQRLLQPIQACCPTTADSAEFCLLCCQPEPVSPVVNCQRAMAFATMPLQTVCLVGAAHPHRLQGVTQSLELLHPAPTRVTGGRYSPQLPQAKLKALRGVAKRAPLKRVRARASPRDAAIQCCAAACATRELAWRR